MRSNTRSITAISEPEEIESRLGGSLRRSVFFFFFQAEDGIRDYKVTVQTCALPILRMIVRRMLSSSCPAGDCPRGALLLNMYYDSRNTEKELDNRLYLDVIIVTGQLPNDSATVT